MNSSSKVPALFVRNRDHCRVILVYFVNHGYGFELGSGFAGVVRQVRRSQWPHGLRRGSAAARLLRFWVRIPQGYGCLSVVSVVCCQVEVSATS